MKLIDRVARDYRGIDGGAVEEYVIAADGMQAAGGIYGLFGEAIVFQSRFMHPGSDDGSLYEASARCQRDLAKVLRKKYGATILRQRMGLPAEVLLRNPKKRERFHSLVTDLGEMMAQVGIDHPFTVLEDITGTLLDYNKLGPGTFCHVDELTQHRLVDKGSRGSMFYTADGHGYLRRENDNVEWIITRQPENLVLRHLYGPENNSFGQLIQTHNFRPAVEEAEAARNAASSVVIPLKNLRLSGDGAEYRSLVIRTADGYIATADGFQEANEDEHRAIDRLGFTPEYLQLLRDSNIKETRILVLHPDYVRENTQRGQSLWRASLLGNFDSSSFSAGGYDVYSHDRLRGVRQGEALSAAPKISDVPPAPSEINEEQFQAILTANRNITSPQDWPKLEAELRKSYGRLS
ncbi:hypothetical protein COV20_04290 [Candidatus Woesearchaeota archaeon CG10_big_fil_rev_8_21_14_0_10_45_16]|nr:MAG: hypothetical protein COV20_04290 [Candidatus Woesearchaeota archaeon CG10_big_fil_rev_8_21_14_0_10_45_16]